MAKLFNIFVTFMLISCLTFPISAIHVNAHESYVQEACSVTRYQDLCVKSLASYSNKARQSPRKWARAGVSVTLREVKLVARYLNRLKMRGNSHLKGRNRSALLDCVECFQDALDNLHKSLRVLRRLSFHRFNEQMNNALTWLSAALTDEDTCLDGFEGSRGKLISRVHDKVQNVSYITSNALALANKLATTGLKDVGDYP